MVFQWIEQNSDTDKAMKKGEWHCSVISNSVLMSDHHLIGWTWDARLPWMPHRLLQLKKMDEGRLTSSDMPKSKRQVILLILFCKYFCETSRRKSILSIDKENLIPRITYLSVA